MPPGYNVRRRTLKPEVCPTWVLETSVLGAFTVSLSLSLFFLFVSFSASRHLPGWFTQVHQQMNALQIRLLEHLARHDEISDLMPPCEAAIAAAEQTEHCCNNPGP